MYFTVPILTLCSAAVLAHPPLVKNTEASEDAYTWVVENYTSTCTTATCRYDFNITGPKGKSNSVPSFDALGCDGSSDLEVFQPCTTLGIDVSGDVQTKAENLGRGVGANVFVRLSYHKDNVDYIYTGNKTVKHTQGGNPIFFEIMPEAHAVAVAKE